jgi:hypothetical protein
MSTEEMIIAGTRPETLDAAADRLRPLTVDTRGNWLADGFRKGFYKTREIQRAGQPQYVVFFSVTDQNALNANAVAFVGDGKPDHALLWAGLDVIAREVKCEAIIGLTERRGMVERAIEQGYKVRGVLVEKVL